jgi:hypothetical protein
VYPGSSFDVTLGSVRTESIEFTVSVLLSF